MISKDYYDYYNEAIHNNSVGLKLVLGGTGLGKTSGILKVIQHADTTDRKFIYIAHRVQLLEEMAQNLEDIGIGFARVLSNPDTVKRIIHNDYLWHELQDLLASRIILDLISHHNRNNLSNQLDLNSFIQNLNYLYELPPNQLVYNDFEDNPNVRIASQVIYTMQMIMTTANDIGGETLTQLQRSPVIREFFPYLKYKTDPEVKVLLITVQKAFMGFFDGSTGINLTKLNKKNGKNIIFLDEYDFLEYELTQLICKTRVISDPFRFVAEFYREMKRHRLARQDYPLPALVPDNLRDRIDCITDPIEELSISYPEINLFTSQLDEAKGVVFQTSRTLVHNKLFLKETERSFEIVKEKPEEKSIDALIFFKAIRKAMFKIIFLFMELKDEHPSIYFEILRQAFRSPEFRFEIERISQLPRNHKIQQTRFDNLLDEGFGMYEVHELNQQTDPEEIELRYYSIFITPEKLISKLAQENLVFGLSATADMLRIVRNFSDEWFRKQAEDRLLNYIEVSQCDYEIIQRQNKEKKEGRNNKVNVVKASELNEQDHKPIWDFVENAVSQSLSNDLPPILWTEEMSNRIRSRRSNQWLRKTRNTLKNLNAKCWRWQLRLM